MPLRNPESHTASGWARRADELHREVERLTRERDEARVERDEARKIRMDHQLSLEILARGAEDAELIARLTRECDEARASCEQLHDQAEIWKAEADALRALLRDLEWAGARCNLCRVDDAHFHRTCQVCGGCSATGHESECWAGLQIKAALEA